MRNFARAMRLALRYRWTLAASIACALVVAVLWGGNIGTLYPVVEVVFKGQSLHEWVDDQIADADRNAATFSKKLAALEAELADAEAQAANDDAVRKIRQQIGYHQSRLEAEQEAAARYRLLKPYINRYLPTGPFETLLVVIGVLLLGTVVKDSLLVVGGILVERLAQLASFDLRKQFYRRTLRMDLASFGDHSTSDLLSRFTNDLGCVTLGIQIFFGRALREPLKMIACLVGAALISWQLLLLSLVVAPVAVLLIGSLARSMRRSSRRAMEEMSLLYNVLVETLSGIKIVKAFTMERYERRRFHQNSKQFYRHSMRIALYDNLVRPTTEVAGILMICVVILAGAYLVLNKETHLLGVRMSDRPLTLGSLLLFYAMLAGVSDPVRKVADVYGQLQRAYAAADRIYEMLDRQPTIVDPPRPVKLPRHCRDLVLEGVHFQYHPSQPVLVGIDLRIAFGETLAIVGPNGCGKSTLANLIPRFFDPQRGSVRLDGVDLRDVRRRDLRRQIGLVTQETLLFNDTVLANIRYGAPRATREQVIAAAKQAHAHRFIVEKLDNGYDTVVGASGNRLSGGQRQRIALARAILRDPAILILDEATSQVDLESEHLIQTVLAEFIRHRTTIIITHRLGILEMADRILVMDRGKILDLGAHAELLDRCDLYRRLYRIDFRESA